MSKILFVSSFNEMIYKYSGIRLINSFLKFNINTDLLTTTEGQYSFDKLNEITQKYTNIKTFNLNNYDYLNDWLQENKNIIPIKYGGLFNFKHKKKDINVKLLNVFNQKASLWFRKVASLKYALDNYKDEYDYIIWIDADTAFLKHLSNDYMIQQFRNNSCFYHLGALRAIQTLFSIESGLIGFKKGDGYQLIQDIVDEYSDKKFLKYARWDDGHIMGQVIINSNIKSVDLINPNKKLSQIECMNPMEYGPFKKYVKHFKGSHHSNQKIQIRLKKDDYVIIENHLLK